MQLTRRQFGIAMILGAVALAISRIFGSLFRFGSNNKGHTAKYWRRADHLGG